MKSKKNVLTLAVVLALFLVSVVSVAKYQVTKNNKGVATAGNFYFTSNYLKETIGINDTDFSDIPYIYSEGEWSGQSDYGFFLTIQNYENRLMFNESGLDVEYEITFELAPEEGQNVEGIYWVKGPDNEKRELSVGNKVSYQGCHLTGGTAKADRFEIVVPAPSQAVALEDYTSVPIMVIATPTAPEYISDSYKEESKKLAAKLVANILADKYSLVYGYTMKKAETDVVKVESWVGFPYEITYTPGSQGVAHTMEMTWNHQMLQMDAHNELYRIAKGEIADDSPSKPILTVDEEKQQTTMNFQIEPYETKKFVFYRTVDFSASTTYEQLQGMITLTDKSVE